MKIALTVSKNYHAQLEVSIKENSMHFDKWFIVSQEDDQKTCEIIQEAKKENPFAKCIELINFPLQSSQKEIEEFHNFDKSDLQISYQCSGFKQKIKPTFEKGLAMRYMQKYVYPQLVKEDDIIIYMDSDVLLPKEFSEVVDKLDMDGNTLYGGKRDTYLFLDEAMSGGEPFRRSLGRHNVGLGFLQVCNSFHLKKERFFTRSLDCGWTDYQFKCDFNQKEDLGIRVKHLGLDFVNWSGNGHIQTFFPEQLTIEEKVDITNELIGVAPSARRSRNRKEREGVEEQCKYPDFIICGFQKSATTAIMQMLDQHPKIKMPKSTQVQFDAEFDYFSKEWSRGRHWYQSHFQKDDRLWGEKSPSYTSHRPLMSSKRIQQTIPDAKLIFSMKDPVEREISAYYHYKKFQWIDGRIPFEDVFSSDKLQLDYYKALSPYLDGFEKEKIHLIICEELFDKPNEIMNGIAEFLEVPQYKFKFELIHGRNEKGKVLRKSTSRESYLKIKKKKSDLIPQKAKDILIEKYSHSVKKIEELLGRKIDLWKNFN